MQGRRKEETGAYWVVREDFRRPRTQQMDFFSSLLDKDGPVPIFPQHCSAMRVRPPQPEKTWSEKKAVTALYDRVPHPLKAAGAPVLPAIDHAIPDLHSKRRRPIEHGVLRSIRKAVLCVPKIDRGKELPQKLTVAARTETGHGFRRFRFEHQHIPFSREDKPSVKSLFGRNRISQREPLFEQGTGGFDIT